MADSASRLPWRPCGDSASRLPWRHHRRDPGANSAFFVIPVEPGGKNARTTADTATTATWAVTGATVPQTHAETHFSALENDILPKMSGSTPWLRSHALRGSSLVLTTVGRKWRMSPFLRPVGVRPRLNPSSLAPNPGSRPDATTGSNPDFFWQWTCWPP